MFLTIICIKTAIPVAILHQKHMWYIHDKKYDLTEFMNHHPGGKEILEACKGKNDCTASFESYHAMCNMSKIKKLMTKYEAHDKNTIKSKQPIPGPMYSFEPNGFYKTV